ncbi:MAG: efflux RND transporter periplasmic adaptor subunit [Flavobacteriales bacterium]
MKLTNLIYGCISLSLALFSCQNEAEHTHKHDTETSSAHAACDSETKANGAKKAACGSETKHTTCSSETKANGAKKAACGSETKHSACDSESEPNKSSACGTKDEHGHVHGHEEEHDNPNFELSSAQGKLLDIKAEHIEKQSVGRTLNFTGHIATPPESFASVYAPLGGFVSWGVLLPGDYVKKGAILAEIEDPNYIELQEQFLKSSAELEFWNKQWQRQEKLKAQDLLSQKQVDEQLLAKQRAEIEYSSLKNQLLFLGISPKHIKQKGIQKRLKIKAPISGYITETNIHLNKYVRANELMYSLVNKSHLHAELQVFTKDLSVLKKDQTFYFSIPGSDDVLKGTIALIGQLVDLESKTVDVHGEILSSTKTLKPGMFIRAEVPANEHEAYALRNTSIFELENQFYVLIDKGNYHYEAIEIEKGKSNPVMTEVRNPNEKLLEFPVVVSSVFELQSAWLKTKGALGASSCSH